VVGVGAIQERALASNEEFMTTMNIEATTKETYEGFSQEMGMQMIEEDATARSYWDTQENQVILAVRETLFFSTFYKHNGNSLSINYLQA